MVRRFGSLLILASSTPTTQSGRGRFVFQALTTCNTLAAKALKELSRPLARERDITSRSEPRCRRQLHKAGGVFLCPVGFYLRAQRATRLLFFPRESSPLASFPLRRFARRACFSSLGIALRFPLEPVRNRPGSARTRPSP